MRKTRTFRIKVTSIQAAKIIVDNGVVKSEMLDLITCVGVLTEKQVMNALKHTYGKANYAIISVETSDITYRVNVMDLIKIATPITKSEEK